MKSYRTFNIVDRLFYNSVDEGGSSPEDKGKNVRIRPGLGLLPKNYDNRGHDPNKEEVFWRINGMTHRFEFYTYDEVGPFDPIHGLVGPSEPRF